MTRQQGAFEAVDGKRAVSGGQVAIVVGALVVALAALWFFFLKGDGSAQGSPAPTSKAQTAATEDAKKEKSRRKSDGKGKAKKDKKEVAEAPKTPAAPVESSEVFAPKDPFEPLIAASTGGTGGSDSSGDSGSNNTSGDTSAHTVRLADIYAAAGGAERARIQVDDNVYRVSEGEVFAETFQLVSIDNGCATILFGDDQFSLCKGEEVLK
jgi:hypothetical protein